MRAASRELRGGAAGRALLVALASALLACEGPPAASEADVPTEISAGELALARGDLEDARLHFERALDAEPRSQRAWIGLARTRVAGGDLDAGLALFEQVELSRIRDAGPATFWDYCNAVLGTAERGLAERRFEYALVLARRGEADGCGSSRAHELSLLARVGLAEEARRSGDPGRALDLYLVVLGPRALEIGREAAPVLRGPGPLSESPAPEDQARLRAYRGAAAILLQSGRREDALSLLYGALMRFPDDTKLVTLMVEALAQPSVSQSKEPR